MLKQITMQYFKKYISKNICSYEIEYLLFSFISELSNNNMNSAYILHHLGLLYSNPHLNMLENSRQ